MTRRVNIDVAAALGVDGTIVIVGAFCNRCRVRATPTDAGVCPWCLSRIVDEDKLSARAMLAQISGREPTGRETRFRFAASPPRGAGLTATAGVHGDSPSRQCAGEAGSRPEGHAA